VSRSVNLRVLDRVHISSPCPMRWEDMRAVGDGERVRHCEECRLHVYNLSAMQEQEAERFVMEHEGRMCLAFYRREDGTILTRDCPVGIALVRAKAARAVARMSAVVGLALSGLVLLASRARAEERLRNMDPFSRLVAWLTPPPVKSVPPPPVVPVQMGKPMLVGSAMACPPSQPLPPLAQPASPAIDLPWTTLTGAPQAEGGGSQ
jgi:hypothetical protein